MMLQVIISLILLLITAPSFVQAAVFQVSTVAELESKLSMAAGNGDDDIINIVKGTYALSASLSYDSHEDKSIVLQGIGGAVTIDGGLINHRLLFVRTYTPNANITISGITFKNGYSPEGENGSGIFINMSSAKLILENSQIIDCFGAAFYFTNHGGGAYITAGLNTSVIIRNCVIAGNSSKGMGGGLYLSLISGTLSFINNTIINNTNNTSVVEGGGGVYLSLYYDTVQADLYNNIFWGNTYAQGDGDLYIEDNADYVLDSNLNPATVNMHYNDYNRLDYNLGTALTLSNNISQDPLLSADFHLSENSPCLDKGASMAPNIPARDFEGDSRSHDGNHDGINRPDMGADEFFCSHPLSILPILLLLPNR